MESVDDIQKQSKQNPGENNSDELMLKWSWPDPLPKQSNIIKLTLGVGNV